jgi:hypothetical protein
MRRPIIPDSFTRQYIGTALWSSNDESDDSGGEPLDRNYDEDDITSETLASMIQDAQDFQRDNAEMLLRAYASGTYVGGQRYDASNAGHDLWLTRNRHGAGFWDRGLPKAVGEALSTAAHNMGEINLYVQRGRIYEEPSRPRAPRARKSKKSGNRRTSRPSRRKNTRGHSRR